MFNVSNLRNGKETLLLELEKNNPRINSAIFDLFPFTAADEARLIKVINHNIHLESLSLLGCRLTSDGTEAIMDAVMGNPHLKYVAIEVFMDSPPYLHTKKNTMDNHLKNNASAPSPG